MAKQLNVSLNFQANTGQAKQSMMELQTLLTQIAVQGSSVSVDDNSIKNASKAAKELSMHLTNAFNAETGNFDLSKLDRSLKASKSNIQDLTFQLLTVGSTGQEAFVKLAQVISTADRPVISLTNKLNGMLTTLKNTARWQISSSVLHGFMGAVQSAYGYAQDLNESLNNIRIVTGYDTAQMAKFAEEANRAAKALSTTTTAYTDASLIFYQQGLSGDAVTERADVVIKMANVTGESATEVSDYMTAVWNNFADGAKELEYYADVMTALGAATASSTDEIAAGLEKFAAVSETVGLSYEYATAALATVTATTRQSADVVGTAFKTLFARIQDLELGETLDDGTTLGTYSQALAKVGINIKDTSGQLKDMDVILEEMASKWDGLSKAQQTALAQAVAGVRQYTQLVALMDNWDFMESNLAVANSADNTLNQQAQIYEESWAAASKRVRASMEAIYDDILDDEFFIDITNGFSALIDSLDAFIDGVGGMKGVLFGVGTVLLSMFSHQIQPALENLRHTLAVTFSTAEKQAAQMANKMHQALTESVDKARAQGIELNESSQTALDNALDMNVAKAKMQAVSDKLNATEKQRAEQELAIMGIVQQETQALADRIVKQKEAIDLTREEIRIKQEALIAEGSSGKAFEITGKDRDKEEEDLIEAKNAANAAFLASRTNEHKDALNQAKAALEEHRRATEDAAYASEQFATKLAESYAKEMEATEGNIRHSQAIVSVSDVLEPYGEKLDKISRQYANHKSSIPDVQAAVNALGSEIRSVVGDSMPELDRALEQVAGAASKNELNSALDGLREALQKAQIPAKDLEKILTKLGSGKTVSAIKSDYQKLNKETALLAKRTEELRNKQSQLNKMVNEFNPTHVVTGLERIAKTAAGLGQVAMMAQSLRAVFSAWSNDDLSFGEKITTTLMSLSMLIPSVIGAIKNLNTATAVGNLNMVSAVLTHASYVKTLKDEAAQSTVNAALQRLTNAQDKELAANAAAKLMVKKGLITADQQEAYAELFLATAKEANNLKDGESLTLETLLQVAKSKTIGTYLASAGTLAIETIAKGGAIGASIAHTATLIAEQLAAWGLNAALTPLLAVILLVVAAIGAVVAVGALLVAAFNAIKNSTPEAKLKAAEEEATRMSQALNQAREAADALKQSIDGYDSAVEKLKTLTQGTEEWTEALNEANAAAQKLIEENPELAGKYSFNANTGLIEFEKGALDGLQNAANQKVTTATSQSLEAQNRVLEQKNSNLLGNTTKSDNALGFALMGGSVGSAIAAAVHDSMQQSVLAKLADEFSLADGNLSKAMDELSAADLALIASLGLTDTELQKMCVELSANNEAIKQNNKQIAHTNYSGNKDYENSSNKDFLAEVLGSDIDEKTEQLYQLKYSDAAGMYTDKNMQKQYAELMGYEWKENLSGNKGKYLDASGQEITIDDEQVRRYLAQQEAIGKVGDTIAETSGKISELALAETRLSKTADGSIESYEQYKKTMMAYGKELGFTEEQIDSFIQKQGHMQKEAKTASLASNIAGWGHDEEASKKAAESLAQGLTDEQLQIALRVSAESSSYDEFMRGFEQALNESILESFQNSASGVEDLMATMSEGKNLTAAQIDTLEQDENFQAYLEETGQTMLDFTSANYSERYRIISSFYADLKASEYEALENSKQNYQADLAEYQAIIDYKRSLDESGKETDASQAIKAQFDNIDFSAYVDMDISDVESEMDKIQEAIDEIDGQKIKLDMEWESTDAIENSMKKIGNFANVMQNDAKKVGNSYQLTAAQAKEWMQVYPELFANADVTTDGLISLNQDYVNEFIGGQEASTDAAIDANIQQLESRISELEAEKEAYEADLELAESNAVGKEQLANASTEFLAEQRERLVDYYINSGLDEVAANKAALNTMGLNEEEYSELVANSYSRNAANQIKSAEQGASGQSSVLGKLWGKIKDWASRVGNLFKNVWGALTGQVQWSDVWGAWSGGSVTSDVQVSGLSAYDHNGNFQEGFEAERNAVLDEVNSSYADALRTSIADIDSRIANIRAEIAYNEALRNQTLDDYGSTDPDDVDGTNDKDKTEEEKQKEIEEMIEDAERYHEITREIEAMERALERLGKQKERAFGADKVALMDKELAAMEDLYKKEEELLNAQRVFLAADQMAIENAFTTDIDLDSNGNISNYSDLVAEAQGALNQARQTYNESAQTDEDKAALEEAEKLYEQRISYLEQYEETLDGVNDQIDKMTEQLYAMQDLQFEKFNYIMEVDMAAVEEELKMIDHYLSKIEDDFYSAEEAARLLVGTLEELSRGQFGGKMQQYMDNLAYAEQKQAELEELYKNKQISEEQYQEGLSNIRDMYYENMAALQELDKQMMEYYSNTLAQAQEELSKYTSQMEHQTAVLEHFQSLITLMGKQNDYKMIGKVLEGQVETTKNSAEVSRQWYEARRAAADDLAAEYADAVERGASPEELEMIKQKWQDAEVAANEAQEQMLADAEAWAEALKAVLENKLADLGQTLENALTGEFGSFDQMTTAMERANSLQEEYLTTTNQIYETNKLMRTAQQEIDKSTNSVAKRKLQAYIEETKELQNQTKLSQYELDIQQAKYDLLLAEIALEEAQQSKSTVRLQRDSEGNFGYVYTADSNQMAEAQQNLEDAQNKLYNIGLDGANDYAQKYQQTMSEMYDTMAQLQQDYLNGAFESEAEYNAAMEAAKQYYYQKLQDYSQLYSVALTTDSRVVSDAWSTDFSSMIYDTEKWMSEVNKYVDGTAQAFIDWQTAVSGPGGVTSIIGGSLEEVGGNVDSVTQKSQALANVTKNEVIPGLESELTAVDNLTGAYARMRDTISQTIEKYEQLINGINDSQTQDWQSEDSGSGSGNGDNTGSNNTGSDSNNTDSGSEDENNTNTGNDNNNGNTSTSTDLTAGQEVTVKTTATKFATGENMWSAVKGNKFKVMSVNGDTVLIGDPCGPNYSDTGITGYVKKTDLEGFDTGGYTGNWGGSYGKLALLHKKELILKEGDTANFLEGMSILDKIVSAIDLYSMNSQLGGMLSSPSLGRVSDNMLEQQVHIEASFPAVQDRNEIEEAFNNLINRASQYANRK